MSTEQITQQALALPPEEREKLAELLYLTLDHSSSEEIEQAWIEEAERRLDKIHNGTAVLLDGNEVMQRMKKRVGL
jgi:putative addiction module component (TIGR02574 family)